jgi:putative endonuclease
MPDLPALLRPPEALHLLRSGGGSSMFYTYVLKSKKDGELYVGWTNDLKNRFMQHNKGLVTATKYRLPMELFYYEACLSDKLAI